MNVWNDSQYKLQLYDQMKIEVDKTYRYKNTMKTTTYVTLLTNDCLAECSSKGINYQAVARGTNCR